MDGDLALAREALSLLVRSAQAARHEADQLRSEAAALGQQQAGLRAAAAGAASELVAQRAAAQAAAARAEQAAAELAAVRDTQAALTSQARLGVLAMAGRGAGRRQRAACAAMASIFASCLSGPVLANSTTVMTSALSLSGPCALQTTMICQ